MRALKTLVIVMGVLIVVGTATLAVLIVRRVSGADVSVRPMAVPLQDEPEGTRIAGIAATADRLALQLQGGGADRVILLDPRTGAVVGRIGLAR